MSSYATRLSSMKVLLLAALLGWPLAASAEPVLVDVQKIWDQSPHNAFTDLVRHKDRWFCVFREGQGHVSPDGAIRVLFSVDWKKWDSAALLKSSTADLRDEKPAAGLLHVGHDSSHEGKTNIYLARIKP